MAVATTQRQKSEVTMMARRSVIPVAVVAAATCLLASCTVALAPLPKELPVENPDAKSRELHSVFNPHDLGITLAELRVRYPNLREWGDPINVEYRGKTRSVDLSAGCFQSDSTGQCRSPQIEVD